MITVDAILLGGGVGRRFSKAPGGNISSLPKQFQILGSAPVFVHALNGLARLGCFRKILIAVPVDYIDLAREQLTEYASKLSVPIQLIPGGVRRQDSSRL